MKKQFTLLLVFLILAFTIDAQIYVKKNATGANNGSSWANAYTTLQAALADPNVTTNEIWIAVGTDGIYKPTTTTNRTISYNIPSGAKIYGGFVGTETLKSQRNFNTNIIRLSGDIGVQNNHGDNSYHVVTFIGNISSATVLDGVRVINGRANGGGESSFGAGIYIYATGAGISNNPQISNCIVRLNNASAQGGGIYVSSLSGATCNPTISNCSIQENQSGTFGGGVYVYAENGTASPGFSNCKISGNNATTEIGGISFEAYNNGICLATMVNCIISGNLADTGGGLGFAAWAGATCSPDLFYCTITGNNATTNGGAFEYWSNDGGGTCNPSFINTLIWGNSTVLENFDAGAPDIDYEYCVVQGSSSASWDTSLGNDGGNNLDTPTYFMAPINPYDPPSIGGDFRMHYASEAVYAGTSAYGTPNDFLGNPRNNPPSMGAYEYAALPGDWNGATDSDWGTTSNWLTGIVATAVDDVYLSSKAVNQPIVNEDGLTPAVCNNLELLTNTSIFIEPLAGLTVFGDLVIDPTATLGINSDVKEIGSLITMGAVTGEIDAERYIGEDEWHLVSTPVDGETANIFFGNYLQTYNEATQVWTEIEDETTPLVPMTGYAMWGTTDPDTYYTFTGVPGTGNQPVAFTADNAFGWNLFGNPFPSSIDWEVVTIPPGMNSAVYYMESVGNYVTYVSGVGGSGSRYVPPMQGFWISATAPGTFSVGNSDRSHLGTDEFYKNSQEVSNYIALQVQSGDMVDKTYIRLNDEATPAFDGKYDAYKLMAPNKIYPQIYTIAGEDKLSISQLPATDVIPLGFYVKNSGNYTISLEKMTDIQSCQLEDLKTGIVQDLEKGAYTFSYTEGENDNRFRLHLTAASVEFSGAEENIKMYAVGQEVFVKSMNSN